MAAPKEFKFEIVEEVGVISSSTSGWNREVNIVRWNDGNPKLDIRDWAPEHDKMGKGISLDQRGGRPSQIHPGRVRPRQNLIKSV